MRSHSTRPSVPTWQRSRVFVGILISLICLLWPYTGNLGLASQPTPQSPPVEATSGSVELDPSSMSPVTAALANGQAVWVLEKVRYFVSRDYGDWLGPFDLPLSGGSVSYSIPEGEYEYERDLTVTYSLPASIPHEGTVQATCSGRAHWDATDISSSTWNAWLAVNGSADEAAESITPPAGQNQTRQDDIRSQRVSLNVGTQTIVVRPSLITRATDSFYISFSGMTELRTGSRVVSKLEIGVDALYRFCPAGGCTSLEGVVVADVGIPLIGVPVALVQGQRVLQTTVTRPPDGRYVLPSVPITTGVHLSVTLTCAETVPNTFRVMWNMDNAEPPPPANARLAYAYTNDFEIPPSANALHRSISFMDPTVVGESAQATTYLPSLGAIYYHTYQAWQLAAKLGQTLDFALPVDVLAFSWPGVYWDGRDTDLNTNDDPYINIQRAPEGVAGVDDSSTRASPNRPGNREWHEFGHHMMADAFGNRMPSQPGNTNHNGYANPSTSDSWAEGFAEFYSLLVGREIAGLPNPEFYQWAGLPSNLELNYRAFWNYFDPTKAYSVEEFALAGLLWDLADQIDAADASIQGGRTYCDCVEVNLQTLWQLLTKDWGNQVAKSPSAPADYGYLYDVKHLYDALKAAGVGAAKSRGGALSDLDEIFVMHGFFVDANDNGIYDPPEEIGRAADAGRPLRRNRPTIPGSYVAFDARDAQTGDPMNVQDFLVEVRVAPPFEHYSYSFRQQADSSGRLFFFGPDPHYEAETHITALTPGKVSTELLVISNTTYWQQMATQPQDHFVEHTFVMTQTNGIIHLPLVLGAPWLAGQQATAIEPDAIGPYAGPTPGIPCVPGGPTATPTASRTCSPTATRTGTITSTPTPSATPTATRTGTVTSTPTPSATPTATDTRTPTPTPTGTWWSPTPTRTHTFTPTPSLTATRTATRTVTRTPTRTATPTATRTATPTATRTHTPTPTRTRTVTPTPTRPPVAGCTWGDEFTSVLQPGWHWMREEASHWSLTARTGFLRITTQQGDLWQDTNSAHNLLVRAAPAGDFDISTHLVFNPTQNGQRASLLVYQDDDDYVRLSRSMNSRNQVEMVYEVNGIPALTSAPVNLTDLYLKIARTGMTYTGYYSADGTNWTELTHVDDLNLLNEQVGLGAWNGEGAASEIPADFDWFCVNDRSLAPHGIHGRVTFQNAPAPGLALQLRYYDGSAWSTRTTTVTDADGRYDLAGLPGLGSGQQYYVRYLNTPDAPNPGPGYLYSWSANRITAYAAGEVVAGGDFDVADILMVTPANNATVTLPAAFGWTARGVAGDNYRLILVYVDADQEGTTPWLGYVDEATISGLPEGWPSNALYAWWPQVAQGNDPDAAPYNIGEAYDTRWVTINFGTSSVEGEPIIPPAGSVQVRERDPR